MRSAANLVKPNSELLSLWTPEFRKVVGPAFKGLAISNESSIPVPEAVLLWWRMVAADRGVRGALRILPFDKSEPFGEIIRDGTAAVFVSDDEHVTPMEFVRSNGAHEIRHLEQNQKPWLIDERKRSDLVRLLLRLDGSADPEDKGFLQRYHDYLPEEVDAYIFQKEVSGFDGRPFSEQVRKAMKGQTSWPEASRFIVPVTRPIRASGSNVDLRTAGFV